MASSSSNLDIPQQSNTSAFWDSEGVMLHNCQTGQRYAGKNSRLYRDYPELREWLLEEQEKYVRDQNARTQGTRASGSQLQVAQQHRLQQQQNQYQQEAALSRPAASHSSYNSGQHVQDSKPAFASPSPAYRAPASPLPRSSPHTPHKSTTPRPQTSKQSQYTRGYECVICKNIVVEPRTWTKHWCQNCDGQIDSEVASEDHTGNQYPSPVNQSTHGHDAPQNNYGGQYGYNVQVNYGQSLAPPGTSPWRSTPTHQQQSLMQRSDFGSTTSSYPQQTGLFRLQQNAAGQWLAPPSSTYTPRQTTPSSSALQAPRSEYGAYQTTGENGLVSPNSSRNSRPATSSTCLKQDSVSAHQPDRSGGDNRLSVYSTPQSQQSPTQSSHSSNLPQSQTRSPASKGGLSPLNYGEDGKLIVRDNKSTKLPTPVAAPISRPRNTQIPGDGRLFCICGREGPVSLRKQNNGNSCTRCCSRMKTEGKCIWYEADYDIKHNDTFAHEYVKDEIKRRLIKCQRVKAETDGEWCECSDKYQTEVEKKRLEDERKIKQEDESNQRMMSMLNAAAGERGHDPSMAKTESRIFSPAPSPFPQPYTSTPASRDAPGLTPASALSPSMSDAPTPRPLYGLPEDTATFKFRYGPPAGQKRKADEVSDQVADSVPQQAAKRANLGGASPYPGYYPPLSNSVAPAQQYPYMPTTTRAMREKREQEAASREGERLRDRQQERTLPTSTAPNTGANLIDQRVPWEAIPRPTQPAQVRQSQAAQTVASPGAAANTPAPPSLTSGTSPSSESDKAITPEPPRREENPIIASGYGSAGTTSEPPPAQQSHPRSVTAASQAQAAYPPRPQQAAYPPRPQQAVYPPRPQQAPQAPQPPQATQPEVSPSTAPRQPQIASPPQPAEPPKPKYKARGSNASSLLPELLPIAIENVRQRPEVQQMVRREAEKYRRQLYGPFLSGDPKRREQWHKHLSKFHWSFRTKPMWCDFGIHVGESYRVCPACMYTGINDEVAMEKVHEHFICGNVNGKIGGETEEQAKKRKEYLASIGYVLDCDGDAK